MLGKRLTGKHRDLVGNVLRFFAAERDNGAPLIPLTSVHERAAAALGISINTVRTIAKEGRATSMGATSAAPQPSVGLLAPVTVMPGPSSAVATTMMPGPSRAVISKGRTFKYTPRKKLKSNDLSPELKLCVRDTIYDMYALKKPVTLRSLVAELKAKEYMNVCPTTLRHILDLIGFTYRHKNNRLVLMEKPDVAAWRARFLRRFVAELKALTKRPFVFLDETWVFAKGEICKSWSDGTVKGTRKPQGSGGKRFIVLHAGTENGFVPNASLIFSTKSKLADYYGDMNGEIFFKWVREKLVPNLPANSVVVMDNASYYSVIATPAPTTAWTKARIRQWLESHNLAMDPNMLKAELLAVARANTPPKQYVVDNYLADHGHEVLRLPPYHCQFNAIELIWAQAKHYYDMHIGEEGHKDEAVLAMWARSLQECTAERWAGVVRHTNELIEKWYVREKVIDEVAESIIHLGDDSDDSMSDMDVDDP